MKHYRALVVEDDSQVRDVLVETLRFSDFEAVGYDEAEKLLYSLDQSTLVGQNAPDLIVVDLELKPDKMQGLDLIAKLAKRDEPAEVLAISSKHPTADLAEAMRIGVAAIVPKPFLNLPDLVCQMQHLADIGMRRRVRRTSIGVPRERDLSRQVRPVFLSYCEHDRMFATGLRRTIEKRNIGVWYAPTVLQPGDEFRAEIERGIDHSSIFIALITDHYLDSPFCNGELMRFLLRKRSNPNEDLLLLPVLDGVSEENKSHALLGPLIQEYQYLDMSQKFVDRLTVLLGRIDLRIMKERKKQPRHAYGSAASAHN
jgi:CheY-like chemotaxis protein